jgi:hypothetical protein
MNCLKMDAACSYVMRERMMATNDREGMRPLVRTTSQSYSGTLSLVLICFVTTTGVLPAVPADMQAVRRLKGR